ILHRRHVRSDVQSDAARLAHAHTALGIVLRRVGNAERGDLAYPEHGFLGELQSLRRDATDDGVRGCADAADQALSPGTGVAGSERGRSRRYQQGIVPDSTGLEPAGWGPSPLRGRARTSPTHRAGRAGVRLGTATRYGRL